MNGGLLAGRAQFTGCIASAAYTALDRLGQLIRETMPIKTDMLGSVPAYIADPSWVGCAKPPRFQAETRD